VRDLNFPIRLIISPLIREKDGLALSSRNKYLSAEERENALVLSRSLKEAKESLEAGTFTIASAIETIKNNIAAKGGKVDYVECVDSETLEDVRTKTGREIMFVLAAYFGSTRLIDNILFTY
jgi:pantoate--beta-alanine ligase